MFRNWTVIASRAARTTRPLALAPEPHAPRPFRGGATPNRYSGSEGVHFRYLLGSRCEAASRGKVERVGSRATGRCRRAPRCAVDAPGCTVLGQRRRIGEAGLLEHPTPVWGEDLSMNACSRAEGDRWSRNRGGRVRTANGGASTDPDAFLRDHRAAGAASRTEVEAGAAHERPPDAT